MSANIETPQFFGKKGYTTGEKSLTFEQVSSLLRIMEDLTDLALFEVAVTGGLRRGDIVKLNWSNLDFSTGKLSFHEQKKKRVHTVFLPQKTLQTLKMLRNANPDDFWIFTGFSEKRHGRGHMSERTAYDRFQEYLVKAGIQTEADRRPFHALRSTCIKLCQKKGWTIEQTAKHVGDTVRVIQEHYNTPSEEEMKAATESKPLI